MHFTSGDSRYVILVGSFAIKIARFRPIHCIRRFFQTRSQGVFADKLGTYHRNRLVAGIKYVCIGIVANLCERRLYRHCPDLRIAPTLCSLMGLINIQIRGEPVSFSDSSQFPFQDIPLTVKSDYVGDLLLAKQFARFPDGIRLVDYGNEVTARELRKKSRFAGSLLGLEMSHG